jgi:hypothetical protein
MDPEERRVAPWSAWRDLFSFGRYELLFLLLLYLVGLALRLGPRLAIDPHLLTFQGDIWYRLSMAQYIQDHWALPEPDLRYRAYGPVPLWYPPLSPLLFALTSALSGVDIPTVSSRLVPFLEALSPLSLYPLGRSFYGRRTAALATLTLTLTPSFVFWTGISDPQSFTLFLLPLLVMLWFWHARTREGLRPLRLLAFGLLLAVNFFLHLSYFLTGLVLGATTLALVLRGEAKRALFLDLGVVLLISQILTAPWWLPRNLYWWWVFSLVTSSGMYGVGSQVREYGAFPALLGLFSLFVLLRHGRKHLFLFFWALPLLLETQNEVLLKAFGAVHLSWSTLAKPLEGFRFFPFLAQPLSLATGLFLTEVIERTKVGCRDLRAGCRAALLLWVLFLLLGLGATLHAYDLPGRFQNSGLILEEVEAAQWFREHAPPEGRIIADYYRSQMFGGITGGKALLGGMFPLRNVDYPYIRAPGQVQNDLYILYNTTDAETAHALARRYGATHIFYSRHMIRYGNLLSYYKSAHDFGVDVETEKFSDERYFETVYREDSPYGEVVIVRVK